MSLLAFATDRHGVTAVADSLSYSFTGRRMNHVDKLHLLEQVGAVTATIGMVPFQRRWFAAADLLADQADDFDALVREAGEVIRAVWAPHADTYTELGLDGRSVSVFLAGYSRKARKWRTYAYHSANGLVREDVEPMFLHPTPLAWRPSAFENARLRVALTAAFDEETPDSIAAWMAPWEAQPPPLAPTTIDGWVELACHVRRSRIEEISFATFGMSCFVGGDVDYVRLTESGADRRVIHTFDDGGAEFAAMVARSLHPVSQLGPCYCGSQVRYLDCCLAPLADEPCWCGSRRTMARCCMVTATIPALAAR